jgi:ABC-type amino acid transport system permease subunit
MLFPISKRNVSKALTYTMLLSACMHLLTALFIAMKTNNPDVANMFNILGISLIFPQLGHGALNCLLGIVTVIVAGVGVYALMQHHDKKQGKQKQRRVADEDFL